MTIYDTLDNDTLSEEDLKMLENANDAEPIVNDDCPSFAEMGVKPKKLYPQQEVTIRLSDRAINKAKEKNPNDYLSVLSNILETALGGKVQTD